MGSRRYRCAAYEEVAVTRLRRTLFILLGVAALALGTASGPAFAHSSARTTPNFCVLEYMNSTTVDHDVSYVVIQFWIMYHVHYHNELDGYFDGAHFCGSIVSITTVTISNCSSEFNAPCSLNATAYAEVVSGSTHLTGETQKTLYLPSPSDTATIVAQSPFLSANCGAATGLYEDQFYNSGWLGSGQRCAP